MRGNKEKSREPQSERKRETEIGGNGNKNIEKRNRKEELVKEILVQDEKYRQ